MSSFATQLNYSEVEGQKSIISPDQLHLRKVIPRSNPYSELLVTREGDRDDSFQTEDSDDGKRSADGSEEEPSTKLAAMTKSMVHYSLFYDSR